MIGKAHHRILFLMLPVGLLILSGCFRPEVRQWDPWFGTLNVQICQPPSYFDTAGLQSLEIRGDFDRSLGYASDGEESISYVSSRTIRVSPLTRPTPSGHAWFRTRVDNKKLGRWTIEARHALGGALSTWYGGDAVFSPPSNGGHVYITQGVDEVRVVQGGGPEPAEGEIDFPSCP